MWPFGFGNKYPYTNFHELNADWILDKIRGLEEAMKKFVVDTKDTIIETVNKWLDDHPEATTTVQDNSITEAKLQDNIISYNKLTEQLQQFITSDGTTRKIELTDLNQKIPVPANHVVQSMAIIDGNYLAVGHLLNNTGNTFISLYSFPDLVQIATYDTGIVNHCNAMSYVAAKSALFTFGGDGRPAYHELNMVGTPTIESTTQTAAGNICRSGIAMEDGSMLTFDDGSQFPALYYNTDGNNYTRIGRVIGSDAPFISPYGDMTHGSSLSYLSCSLGPDMGSEYRSFIRVFNNEGVQIGTLAIGSNDFEIQGISYYNNDLYVCDPNGNLYKWTRTDFPSTWATTRARDRILNCQNTITNNSSTVKLTDSGYTFITSFKYPGNILVNKTETGTAVMGIQYIPFSFRFSAASHIAVVNAHAMTNDETLLLTFQYTINNNTVTLTRVESAVIDGSTYNRTVITDITAANLSAALSAAGWPAGTYGIHSIGDQYEIDSDYMF